MISIKSRMENKLEHQKIKNRMHKFLKQQSKHKMFKQKLFEDANSEGGRLVFQPSKSASFGLSVLKKP